VVSGEVKVTVGLLPKSPVALIEAEASPVVYFAQTSGKAA
jgi:hypothetical protein